MRDDSGFRNVRGRLGRRTTTLALTMVALGAGASVAQASDGDRDTRPALDLREGAVYTMTNARSGNEVVAFARRPDGTLARVGAFATGGTGSGSFEDTANGLVLGSSQGEAAPNNLLEEADLLFATNARSNTIATFRVERSRLRRVDVQDSGGRKPVSVTVNRGIVYVLNSGEATDDLFDSDGNAIPNCTTGTPSITGFTVSEAGALAPIAGSTRRLSGLAASGCAQISFDPSGQVLVATERLAGDEGPPGPEGDEGVIATYTRNPDGTLNGPRVTDATGEGPFGFTFTKSGTLLTTEQSDGPLGPGRGAVAAYTLGADGALTPLGGSTPNGGTDTCWIVATDDGRYAYSTSFFGDGRISSYRITPGGLQLQDDDVSGRVTLGASDISLSRDSRFLYQLNSFEGTLNVFRVRSDGDLGFVQRVRATSPSAMGARIGISAS